MPFLFDETVRLKNKIGQQMGQIDGQKGSKELLHVCVATLYFCMFLYDYEKVHLISDSVALTVSCSCQ